MAGVVAMASVIEDFDKQPCKKSRKDGGSPVVKTITNYFSPVVKPAEKPFSPPRSNNIMDYFSRKTPASKERSVTPEQTKENCQHSFSAGKQSSQKLDGKSSKTARKLVATETVDSSDDGSCIIIEDLCDRKDLATKVSNNGVLGSDTAVLLAQVCSQSCATAETSAPMTDGAEQGMEVKYGDNAPKCRSSIEHKSSPSFTASSPVAASRSEVKQVKSSPRNSNKKAQMKTKPSEKVKSEAQTAMCDVSIEANSDEPSPLNNSTVTISFEDFVRSQREENTDEENTKITTRVDCKIDTDQGDTSNAEENVDCGEPLIRVSPRTITIQAEVHAVSPQQESTKLVGKVASIFNQRKKAKDVISSAVTVTGQNPPCVIVKRRSNVVLEEKDLELSEIESESTPKCSEAEKKQFMAAFKQPSVDGSKTKLVKTQVKQKQLENTVEADDDAVIPPTVDKVTQTSMEGTEPHVKPSRKKQNKAKEENETLTTPHAAAAVVNEMATEIVIADEQDEPAATSSVQTVRRSRRVTAGRKEPEIKQQNVKTTRKQNESKGDVAVAEPLDSPVSVSTPKTRKSKRDAFVAEMMSPPDAKGSPIRMKLTRVKRTAEVKLASDENTTSKTSDESKKRKRAKKLVEKAKVIQSKKTSLEEKSTLRRSSRTEASVKRSYCDDEDSIVFVEEIKSAGSQKTTEKSKNQKPLRSLNDVLGRAAGKESKAAPAGSKATEKTGQKVSAVISIFDDSSRDDSENSLDNEQFKARREFLKSGFPESFRKQIAKTAATKEAHSLSSSSFQPVTHTTQSPNDCPLWSLPWPDSSLLRHLKDLWSRTSSPCPSVGGALCVKTEAACSRRRYERSLGRRPEIPESVRQLLLEELRASNPQFPAQMFMARFQKRRADYHQQHKTSEAVIGVKSTPPPAEPACGKRKRRNDEAENTAKVPKKLRSNHSESSPAAEAEPTKRGRCSRRTRKTPEENDKTAPVPAEEDSVVILDDLIVGEVTVQKDEVKEDVLWTDKYQPQHSTDIVGNAAPVKRLHSWLKEWKLRADREERKKQKDKKQEEDSSDVEWDCGEEDEEDMLCNTMILTGPTGVGKTAAVYACAQELGFKVFEVNASSQRSGRLILSQLKEATQSHQVDGQGVSAHKPSYFNSYGTSSSAGSIRPGSSPRKNNSPRRVVSSPRKHPQSPRGTRRGALAPTSLASYFFKVGQPNKGTASSTKNEQPAASKKVTKASEGSKKHGNSATEKNNEELNKKTATSLILFEEVDVIFDDDLGFLAAIKTFMTTTKRPVILTTSDPAFSTMFDGSFEELHFQTPSVLNVGSYLQLLCLAEDMRTDLSDVTSLLRLNGCDIRQSLLQLQFWTCSAGDGNRTRPSVQNSKDEEQHPENKEESLKSAASPLTSSLNNSTCTESKLGLLNIEPERHIWELLKDSSLVDDAVCWELLTNSKRRGVDLLYSNMERLLPLPLTQLSASARKAEQSAAESNDCSLSSSAKQETSGVQSSTSLLQMAEADVCSESESPIKMSHGMRKKRRRCTLDQDGPQSDSEGRHLCPSKPSASPEAKEETAGSQFPGSMKRKPLTPEERAKSVPVSQCLHSLAEFFDNMSYMDSCLVSNLEEGDTGRQTSPANVAFKDGMADESRDNADRGRCLTDCSLEIQAAVEALSFRRCCTSVTEAWSRTQELEAEPRTEAAAELSLPVAAHRGGYSFFQDGPCPPQLVQQRRGVMETLAFGGVFGSPFNRAAAALDYLPVIRTICRSEQLKEQGKVKRRFLHYLDVIHMALEKRTLQLLAEDFP